MPTAINQRRRDEEETETPSRPPAATGLETGHGRTCTGPADQASRHTFSRLSRPQVVRQDVKKVSSAGRHGGRGVAPWWHRFGSFGEGRDDAGSVGKAMAKRTTRRKSSNSPGATN